MKKRLLPLMLSLVLALSLCSPAFAAEELPAPVSVQLDGQVLNFDKVAPKVIDQRTYLPFRAVFEAMGVTVDYAETTKTIVATRGDRTIKMVIGAPEATVIDKGFAITVPMENPAFAQDGVTYVPVRFAAETFGCNVGWDRETGTAIIVDVEKMAQETLANNKFTLLEKLMKVNEKYAEGTWALSGGVNMDVSAMGNKVVTVTAPFTGVVKDSLAMQMAMKLDMDMTGLIALLKSLAPTDSAKPVPDPKMKLNLDMRMDMNKGILYMNMGDFLNEQMKQEKGTWFSMDFAKNLEGTGVDFPTLLAAITDQSMDGAGLFASLLSATDLDGKSATGYQEVKTMADEVVKYISDSAFTQKGDVYTTTLTFNEDGAEITATLDLTTNTTAVTAYKIAFTGAVDLKTLFGETTTTSLGTDKATFSLNCNLKATGKQTVTMNVTLGTLGSLDITADVTYKKSTVAPITTPPEGAKVVDMSTMTGAPDMGGELPDADEITVNITITGKDGKAVTKAYVTDERNLGEFLDDADLIESEDGQYGRFLTAVNGYTANADLKEWWCITKGGADVMTGVDLTPIANGDTFELTLKTF